LEEKAGNIVKSRGILDRARLAISKSPELWTESVRIERRANNISQAKNLMAQALQQIPSSGLLYSESIWYLEPRTQRKPRALEAIKKVDNDPMLFVTIARIFWGERKLEKAQNWFEKAILLDSDLGDTWAWYYKFLLQHGTEVSFSGWDLQYKANIISQEKRADVVAKCTLSEPRHGEIWQSIAKEPKNAGKNLEEILNIVVGKLE